MNKRHFIFIILGLFLISFSTIQAQNMSFEEYNPPSTLVVPEHEISKAKYPFIDVHSHQYRMPDQDLKALTAEMDKINMGIMVNLSGRGFKRTESGGFGVNDNDYLKRAIENSNANASGRVVVFTNLKV